ncbi:unnamed protein product [Brassicogethes aeneus]|uniref:Uncharacterized protein n=1 Tax=Brassicogethes aeneus TaxID=1431903 RepID=A0A9P0B082_BRAAE|nr:unnamed protein product [Brassicogethes aeneus]
MEANKLVIEAVQPDDPKKYFILNIDHELAKDKRDSTLEHTDRSKLSYEKFSKYMDRFNELCFITTRDVHMTHENRIEGLKIIRRIIHKASPSNLSNIHIIHILWGYLTCLHHFQTRLILKSGPISWFRQRKFKKVAKFLDSILNFFPKEYFFIILSSVLTFFKVGKLWENEEISYLALSKTLLFIGNIEDSFMFLIQAAEEWAGKDAIQARDIIEVLFEMMDFLKCKSLPKDVILKFITIFQLSIDPDCEDNVKYIHLNHGIQTCIGACIKHFSNKETAKLLYTILNHVHTQDLSEDAIIAFASLAENAASRLMYNSPMKTRPIPIITLCFKFIKSKSFFECMLGLVVYQNLWDRYKNKPYFTTPRIFQSEENFNLTFALYARESGQFFKSIRNRFQECFLSINF